MQQTRSSAGTEPLIILVTQTMDTDQRQWHVYSEHDEQELRQLQKDLEAVLHPLVDAHGIHAVRAWIKDVEASMGMRPAADSVYNAILTPLSSPAVSATTAPSAKSSNLWGGLWNYVFPASATKKPFSIPVPPNQMDAGTQAKLKVFFEKREISQVSVEGRVETEFSKAEYARRAGAAGSMMPK